MSIELTVLGASGSYGGPAGGACSGYLLRAGDTSIWLDCGNGTLVNLQRHLVVDDLSAVVVTHRHADHCVDLFGLHVMMQYYLGRQGPPVYAPPELRERMEAFSSGVGDVFPWTEVDEGDEHEVGAFRLRFSRTDHPPPTVAVEAAAGGKRMVYTSDTGPEWSPSVFGEGADLLLCEATYQQGHEGNPVHLSASQAGEAAREAGARRLMITHLSPLCDPSASVAEAEAAYGSAVTLAASHLRVRI